METEQAEKFAQALNSVDWTDKYAIEKFSDELEDLGVTFDGDSKKIEHLEKEMIEFAKTVGEIDFEKVVQEISSLVELSKNIKGRDLEDKVFSKEEFDKFVSL
jgi:hypothetical protein